MSSTGFGNNRLATGFHKTRAILAEQAAVKPASPSAPLSVTSSPGASAEDAIEISDDESSSEGGGMLLNVGDGFSAQPSGLMTIDNEDQSEEEGELRVPETENPNTVAESFNAKQSATDSRLLPNPQIARASGPGADNEQAPIRLGDLSQPDFELQTRYVFTSLDRHQIDLNWPAACLECLQHGHMKDSCPENTCTYCGLVGEHPARLCPTITRCTRCRERGHTVDDCNARTTVTTVPCDLCGSLGHPELSCPERFFPPRVQPETAPVRLWIYCCNCASKSHYVGDCPDLGQSFVTSWSTKSITHSQIINLSLGSNMRDLELQAENRGLRPQGLSIKGRAGLHHAGHSGDRHSDNSNSSDDDFLRPKIDNGRHNHSARHDFSFRAPNHLPSPSDRARDAGYDRYNPPSTSLNRRPRNDWYATDSFGQRHSRSPDPEMSQPRRRNGVNDSENLRRRSRSPAVFDGSRTDRVRPPLPPVKGAMSINLPVRRGSSNANDGSGQAIGSAAAGGSHIDNGAAKSNENDQQIGTTGAVKMTARKSKQTKVAAQASQVDTSFEVDSSKMRPQHSQAVDTDPSPGGDFQNNVPPEFILRQFVDAMNVHRESIGHRFLVLKPRARKHGRTRDLRLIDRTLPAGQRLLEIDKKRAKFIWQWSMTQLPKILRQMTESATPQGAAMAKGRSPLDQASILLASLVPESRAFLALFGPPGFANKNDTRQNWTKDAATDKNPLLDARTHGVEITDVLDLRQPTNPFDKPVSDNATESARISREEDKPLRRHEFKVYLDLLNAPRFDLGIGPIFLKCEKGCFYFVDSAVLDYDQRCIPVNVSHVKDIWGFLRAYPVTQRKARLEVIRRLKAWSHPIDRSLTREAAEKLLEGIVPPNAPTRAMSAIPGGDFKRYTQKSDYKTNRVTRSQHADLVVADYDALEEAERAMRNYRSPSSVSE